MKFLQFKATNSLINYNFLSLKIFCKETFTNSQILFKNDLVMALEIRYLLTFTKFILLFLFTSFLLTTRSSGL